MSFIPEDDYQKIVRSVIILSVDIFIKDGQGRHLLIKRTEEPLKGEWWIVGGRVHKGETVEEAAVRKAREEVGVMIKNLVPLGYYEDQYNNGRHSVSIVFMADRVNGVKKEVFLDSTSSEHKWSKTVPDRLKNLKSFY